LDWIEAFLDYTEGITSPEIYRLWTGISAVAGALERRVWVETSRGVLYPNMFCLLVGPPGVGKSNAISIAEDIWYSTKKFKVAPNNVTKAALVDALLEADRKIILPNGGGLVEYHTLLTASSEFGVLVPAHDLEFLSVLNYIYDNPKVYRENRRTLNKNIEIIHPQITILAGTQPGFLASLLPEEAWSMGFTSRIIMIYAGTPPIVDLFGKQDDRRKGYAELVNGLSRMSGLMGRFMWEPEAQAELSRWHLDGAPPVPDHSKLVHYNTRRTLHVIKLSMVSAASRSEGLVITLADVTRARDWLLHAETVMPDVFREMVQKSDSTVIQELHHFVWRIFAKEQRNVHESRLIHFLQHRVTSDKVLRVLDIAERSGILVRDAGMKTYKPRPRNEHGLE